MQSITDKQAGMDGMSTDFELSRDELELIQAHRKSKGRNPDYVLWDFDDNLRKVLTDGYDIHDRTGVGCKVLTGITSRIDISSRIPVPTRRATRWQSMLKEYLWFISGSHNINDLDRMGSRVWDYWRDDQFTMENDFPSGSIGYGYGFNLIHYGGDIRNVGSDPGFNQLEYVIDLLKNDPASRRIYDYTADDFELEDYKPLDKQNVPIAI
jgi:thymidylate synthase